MSRRNLYSMAGSIVHYSRYPDEKVAEVISLAVLGYRPAGITTKTGVPTSTIVGWLNEQSQVIDAEQLALIKDQRQRIAARTGQLLEDYLDKVESGEKAVSGRELGILYGIASDKQQQAPTTTNVGVYVIFKDSPPDIIDGEAHEVP